MSLTIEQILAAKDRRIEPVEVPEWGGTVYVRLLSGAERDALEDQIADLARRKALGENTRARFAVAYMCDVDGNPIAKAEHMEQIGQRSSVVLERIVCAGNKLNRIDEQEIDALGKA